MEVRIGEDVILFGKRYSIISFIGKNEFCIQGDGATYLCNKKDLFINGYGEKTLNKTEGMIG